MDKTVIMTALMLGLVGLFALNVKNIIKWFWNFFIDSFLYTLRIDESSPFFYGVQEYVITEKSNAIKNAYYRNIYDNWIDGETTRETNIFYNRGLLILKTPSGRILLSKENMLINNTTTPYKNEKQSFYLYAWRKKPLSNLTTHIKTKYINNVLRYHFNHNGDIMVYGNIVNKTFKNIFLNDNIKSSIIQDLDKFNASREYYESIGLKYKRTYLFYGDAGVGKSSLATAIANYCKRDILTINVSKDMTDSTLISLIAKRPRKSIVLFEDIDCLFDEMNRENDAKEKTPIMKISLSCVLNILDGSYTPNDIIFIITTNHIEKLDSALKRDGRVNMLLKIGLPNEETKRSYLEHISKFNKTFNPDSIDLNQDVSISTLEKNIF